MRKLTFLLLLLLSCHMAQSQAGHLIINQVYGGGGNAGATFKNDFIELFNPSSAPITFTNWSIQYASAAATGTWNDIGTISGTIPAGGYYLIQLQGGTVGADLPTPDAIFNSINLAAANGKVALVSHNTSLSGTCPVAGVIDFVGYGTANCSEVSTALAGSNVLAIVRIPCTDRDNNGIDFLTDAPNPRNSTAPVTSCYFVNNISTDAVSGPFCVNSTTSASGTVAYTAYGTFNTTFTAYLSDASGSFTAPVSIGSISVNATDPAGVIPITIPAGSAGSDAYKIRVASSVPAITGSASVYFSVVNGVANISGMSGSFTGNSITVSWTNPSNCFDEIMLVARHGSAIVASPTGNGSGYDPDLDFGGSGTAFDGGKVVYKGTVSGQTITGLSSGSTYYIKAFTRKGSVWSNGIEISVMPRLLPAPGEILINQLSPDYAGASDEYIELVNTTNKIFNLSDLAIRYQSASGVAGLAGGTLSGTLLARQFWLLSPNATLTVGLNNGTARDGAFTAGMAATGGQVALVRVTDNTIIDAVGYGTITGGAYTETAAASAPPVDGGLRRVNDGVDNNNNSTDFVTVANGAIRLRNSGSGVLNIQLKDVRVQMRGTSVIISFTNAYELNIEHYEIQRTSKGNDFQSIAWIRNVRNNNMENHYEYFDQDKVQGVVYYRVKAVSKDGLDLYSSLISLKTTSQKQSIYLLSQNRNNNRILLKGFMPAGKYSVIVSNYIGQILMKEVVLHNGGALTHALIVHRSFQGWYHLQFSNDERTFTVKGFLP
jgi:hypothetical protein